MSDNCEFKPISMRFAFAFFTYQLSSVTAAAAAAAICRFNLIDLTGFDLLTDADAVCEIF